ncbi:MAG: hypothetical protein O6913_07045 [Chloroflexi bacterium]|nr:hypothetical protein [Chloroflexota bacterium]
MTPRNTAILGVFAYAAIATFIGLLFWEDLVYGWVPGGVVMALTTYGFIATYRGPKNNAVFIMIFMLAAFVTIVGAFADATDEHIGVLQELSYAWIPGAAVMALATYGFLATYRGPRRDAMTMTAVTIGAFSVVLVMAIAVGDLLGDEGRR